MPILHKVGDRVICVYRGDPMWYGKIGNVSEVNSLTYFVIDDNGEPIARDGWSENSSFKKLPDKTKPLVRDRIIEGVKVVFISTSHSSYIGLVGNIYRTSSSTFRVRTTNGEDVGGGYWNNSFHYFHEVIEESPNTLRSGSEGIAIQEVTIPVIIAAPCPLKYYGTDSCTCGTCPPKAKNPFFLKF